MIRSAEEERQLICDRVEAKPVIKLIREIRTRELNLKNLKVIEKEKELKEIEILKIKLDKILEKW